MLCTNQAEEVRALCAVLLRKSVMASATQAQGSLISVLSPAVGQALKSHLLACIQSEPKQHIRKNLTQTMTIRQTLCM